LEQCPETGWPVIVEAHLALRAEHDPVTAREKSAEAVASGRSLGNVNLEMLALGSSPRTVRRTKSFADRATT